ncbi:MAG: hypothetical protein RBT50_02740 [Bacteroidales bacterium]|jgi:hypothetical protein|nr:hypothetical protein [Bacteroidales bacterium]
MEQEKIRELLDRYFNGETNEEEELLLNEYLRDPALPEELREEYGYLADLTVPVPEPSEGFAARLEAVTHSQARMKSSGVILRLLAGTGAAAAILAGVWLTFRFVAPQQKDTYSDPLIAMAEVREILLDVSGKMNSGTCRLEQIGTITRTPEELEGMARIGDMIGRNLSRLRYLDEQVPLRDEKVTH